MSQLEEITGNDPEGIWEILSSSGYSDKAINYFLNKTNMGSLADANQVTELTGVCGDTMKIYLKIEEGRIRDAKIQVLGCPGFEDGRHGRRQRVGGRPGSLAVRAESHDVGAGPL